MKRPLIIGNALLFAACLTSCDDDPAPSGADQAAMADGAVDQSIRADMAAQDMAAADQAPPADMAAQDMAPADMAAEDMAQADMAIEDMAIEPDMAAVDMAAEDMAVAPDMAASTCQDLIGQRCELDFQQGCCEPGSDVAVVICSGGTYRATGDGDFCNCFGNPAEVACAVPGFVGVHRSGWRPQRVMRLRAVA